MAYEQNELQGSLFKNDKREKDTHPHMQGTALIDGVEYWISAWTKDGAKGRWQSLSFTPKEKKGAPPPRPANAAQKARDVAPSYLDDDIPFN